jgi:hypothetical protein
MLSTSSYRLDGGPDRLVQAAERRHIDRRRLARAATIIGKGEHSAMPCVVLDLSGCGARLGVPRDLAIPARFHLAIERENLVVECRIGWRRGNAMGVEFLALPQVQAQPY